LGGEVIASGGPEHTNAFPGYQAKSVRLFGKP